MDLEGNFSCCFTIKDQPCGEQFRIVIESAMSVYNEKGNLKDVIKTSLLSRWIFIDKSIKLKRGQRLDIINLFSEQTKGKNNENEDSGCEIKTAVNTKGINRDCNLFACVRDAANLSLAIELKRLQVKAHNYHHPNNLVEDKVLKLDAINNTEVSSALSLVDRSLKKITETPDESGSDDVLTHVNVKTEPEEVNQLNMMDKGSWDKCRSDLIAEHTNGVSTGGDSFGEKPSNESNGKKCVNGVNVTRDNDTPGFMELKMEVVTADEIDMELSDMIDKNGSNTQSHRSLNYDISPVTKMVHDVTDQNENLSVSRHIKLPRKRKTKAKSSNHAKSKRRRSHGSLKDETHFLTGEVGARTSRRRKISRNSKENEHEEPNPALLNGFKSENAEKETAQTSNSNDRRDKNDKQRDVRDNKQKADPTRSRIEKYKKMLIDKGLESNLPVNEMNPRLLLAKLKQELKLSERTRVNLSDHKDKYEIKAFVSNEQKNRSLKEEDRTYKTFTCKICTKFQTTSEEQIRIHIESHLNGDLKCKWCGAELSHIFDKRAHYRKSHPDKYVRKKKKTLVRVCDLCGEKCNGIKNWEDHMFKSHGISSVDCKVCHDKFQSRADLTLHMNKLHSDKVYSCDKCGKQFLDEWYWAQHNAKCSGEMPLADSNTCHLCGNTYAGIGLLWTHIKAVHNQEKHHQCTLCSYSCFKAAKLKRHMDAHLGNKNYSCHICGFATVQKYQLTSHMRIHTKEKPFKCDQCTYASAWNVQLKSHRKIHDLENTVTCDCGVVLKDTRALARHTKKDHSGNDNSCD